MSESNWASLCDDIGYKILKNQKIKSLPSLTNKKVDVDDVLQLANIPSLFIRLPRVVFAETFVNYLKSISEKEALRFLSGLNEEAFLDFTQTNASPSIGERIPVVVEQLISFRDTNADISRALLQGLRDEFLRRNIDPENSIAVASYFLANDSSRNEVENTHLLSLMSHWFGQMNPDHLWRFFSPQNQAFIDWALHKGSAGEFEAHPGELLNYFWVCVAFARDRLADLRPIMTRTAAAMPKQRTARENRVGNSLAWIGDSRITQLAATKPGIQPKRKARLRIALCVSGQMRGYQEAFPTWRNALSLDDVDFDLYLHTWKLVGRKKLTPSHSSRNFPAAFAKVFAAEWNVAKSQFPTRYPTLFNLFENKEYIDTPDVQNVLQPVSMVVDEDNIFPDSVPNVFRMHYKNERCYDLAQMAGKDYDLFVRLRPDKSFNECGGVDWEKIYTSVVEDGYLYTDSSPKIKMPHGLIMGDQFLIAGASSAAAIFRSWSVPAALTQPSLGGQLHFHEMGYLLRQHYSLAIVSHFAGCHAERFPYPIFFPAGGLIDPASVPMSEVYKALMVDASDRMDAIDKRLLSVAKAEI